MIRKWMTVLLSLLLAFALPMSALADTQHTFTVVPGDLLASDQAIVDLLNAVDLRLTQGERSGALSVLINDQPLVTLGLTADTTGLYASSKVLGADVLYVTWEDGFAMLTDLAKASMQEQGITDPAVMESIDTSLQETKDAIITAVGAGTTAVPQTITLATMEESLEMVSKLFPDDPEMADYVKTICEKMTIEDGSFADENRDTADQKYAIVMDETDMIKVCDTAYMRTLILESLATESPESSEAELAKATDEVIAEVKKLFEENEFELVTAVYSLDEGQTLVGMDMVMSMTLDVSEAADEEMPITMQMNANYDRLTDAEGVSYKADGGMTMGGEVVQVAFDLYRANSGKSEGMLGLMADGEEFIIQYGADNTAANTREREISVFMRSGATTILPPSASARPLIAFEIKTEPAPVETLAALEMADPDNSVNVLELSDAEMQNLLSSISTNAMQVMYTALGELPTSVLNLIISSMAE